MACKIFSALLALVACANAVSHGNGSTTARGGGGGGAQLETTDGSLNMKVAAGKSILFTIGASTVDLGSLGDEAKAYSDGLVLGESKLRLALQETLKTLVTQSSTDTREAAKKALDTESAAIRSAITKLSTATAATAALNKKKTEELLALNKKKTEELLVAANKKIAALEDIVKKNAAVIAKHTAERKVDLYAGGTQVVGPLKGAQYFNGNKWQVVKDRAWKIPGKGRYLFSATLRTIHKDGQSGFTKLYIRQKNGAAVTSSVRMCSEYRSARGFGESNMNAQFFWLVDVPKQVDYEMMAWKNCQDNKCGLINDNTALEEMTFIKLPRDVEGYPGSAYKRIRGGGRTSRRGGWSDFNSGNVRYNLQGAGTYVLFYTGRTYQGANGFMKHRLVDSREGHIGGSDRMVTEYQGQSFMSFTNHAASFVWVFKKNQGAFSFVRTQTYATASSIGWQNDSNGYAETSYFRVTNPDNVFQKIIKGGRYNFATGTKWKTLPNYSWDLPHAGKYTLIVTLRTYTSSAGWGKVKLDVAPNDDAKKAKLNVADNEKVKYGKSQRMMVYWKTKRFSFVNHAATFTWQVEVTGKLKIVLQGSASAGNIGIQNDSNGYASCIWLKMQGVEKGILA